APADLVDQLSSELRSKRIEQVEAELVEALNPDVCSRILDSLYDREAFAKWKASFAKAIKAHAIGDYELAIPIWLVAIDGICREEIGISRVYSSVQKEKEAARLLKQLSR